MELNQAEKKILQGTAGTEHPRYIMFWTNEANLNMLAQHFGGADVDSLLPLGPSSQVVFELFEDKTGNLEIRTIINDQLVKTDYCTGQK